MHAIGYYNTLRSWPAPVTLLVTDGVDHFMHFPTGLVQKVSDMETFDPKVTEYTAFLQHQKVDVTSTAFAFLPDQVFIGTPFEVIAKVREHLSCSSEIDSHRGRLELFLQNSSDWCERHFK